MSFEDDVNAWVAQAKKLYDERELTPAEQLFDRALRYMPFHEDALLGWGLLYAVTGRGPLALQKIQQIQKENPDKPGPYRAIGTLLRVSGKFQIAENYFTQHLPTASHEVKPFLVLGLAEVYACQDKHTELKSLLTELVDYPSVEVLLQAQLYFELGQVNELTRLASLNAEPVMEDTILGMAAELTGDMTAAGQHYFTVSEAAEPTWIALNGLAAMWLNAGEISHCRTYLEEAERLAPEAPEVVFTRACYYRFQDNKESAKKRLEQIIATPSAFGRIKRLAKQMLTK